MSTQQRSAFAAAITRVAGYSRKQLQESITRTGFPVKKNISNDEMRKQIIKIITAKFTKAAVEYIETPAGKAAAKAIAKPIRARLAPKTQYFTTYQMNIWDESIHKNVSTLYSFISKSKNPDAEAVEKFSEWIAQHPHTKGYESQFLNMQQVASMNVPIKNKAQLAALRTLTGAFQGRAADKNMDEITKTIVDLKLQQRLYREVRKIDGFPDKIDKGDSLCVKNFLVADMGYKQSYVDEWFRKRNEVFADYIDVDAGTTYNAQDLVDFAVQHNRSYYLLDRTKYCFKFAIGKNPKERALFAMIEDSHVYPIADTTARRSIAKKVSESIMQQKDRDTRVANAVADRDGNGRVYNWVKSLSEAELFEDDIPRPGSWVLTAGKNLNNMLDWFVSRGYVPSIEYADGSITKLQYETTCVQLNAEYDECDGTAYSNHAALAFAKYDAFRTAHPEIMGAQYGGVALAKHWISENIEDSTHIGLDFSKFYYNCAMKLEGSIPVFSVGSKQKCDEFTDDGSFYYVITDDVSLFRGCDYYTCEVLRVAIEDGIEFTIDHKLVPAASYDAKLIQDYLTEIVAEFGGDLNRAKKSLVRFIGLLARNRTTRNSAYLVPDDEGNDSAVLYYYLEELKRGKDVQIHVGAFPGVHLIEATKHKQHSVSAGTAHRAIINRSYIEMYRVVKPIAEYVRGVKTDCIILRRSDDCNLESIIESCDIPMKIEKVRKCGEVAMVLKNETRFDSMIAVAQYESEYIERYWENAAFPEEFGWMQNIVADVVADINERRFVRVEGIAGAGKSHLAREIVRVFSGVRKVMCLAPDWVAAANLGENGCTFHTRFQLGFDSSRWFKNIVCGDLSNTIVIIDEVSKLDQHLIALVDYLRGKAFAIVVMGDCEHQLQPVEKSDVSVEMALNEFVDSYYVLEVCKRGADIMQPALKLFEGVSSVDAGYTHVGFDNVDDLANKYIAGGYERLICKNNAFRNAFNSRMVELCSNGCETREVSLETSVNVKEKKTINTRVFVGMKLVSVCNRKELNIIKSDRATVISLNPFTVEIDAHGVLRTIVFEENKRKTLSAQLKGLFDIGYAITCYKSQSATYDFKYMITDFDCMSNREKFVAATRATKFENIVICYAI